MFEARHAPHPLAPETARVLAERYAEPHRAYHDARHIAEVLAWFDTVAEGPGWRAPDDVFDAILFHDAVYDARAPHGESEARSAELALAHGCSARTAELIRLTARHGSLRAEELDADAAHFLDADTAILGAEPAAFDAYDAAIRVEYGHVPEDAYRAGRGAFLAKLAGRPRLFLTDFFHARLEAPARANLARALARLDGG